MKRILLLVGLLGCLGLLMATTDDNHTVFWCHYPPGMWTGVPSTSKVLILSIDVAAEPVHLTHSPSLSGAALPCVGADCAEGVTLTGDATGCPGAVLNCPAITACTLANGVCNPAIAPYPLVQGPVAPFTDTGCVCPMGTPNQGRTPIQGWHATSITGVVTLSCGAAG